MLRRSCHVNAGSDETRATVPTRTMSASKDLLPMNEDPQEVYL